MESRSKNISKLEESAWRCDIHTVCAIFSVHFVTGARIRNGEKPGQVVLDVKIDWRRGKPNLYLDVNPYLSPAITAKVTFDFYFFIRIR